MTIDSFVVACGLLILAPLLIVALGDYLDL